MYLPIMFTIVGLTAGTVYWQEERPVFIITAYCGASIPSLLLLGSLLEKQINRSLEVSETTLTLYVVFLGLLGQCESVTYPRQTNHVTGNA